MLQQTTVNTVIPYYMRWIENFPTIKHVARAREMTILKSWQGLGYYQRARNIHRAARIICRDFNGRLPDDAVTLKSLPGFGPYTVGAVLNFAFDKGHPVIDTNIRRVIMRVNGWGLNKQPTTKALETFLKTVIPLRHPGIFNQALMEIGALICRSREPRCGICPLPARCRAYREGTVARIPPPKTQRMEKISTVVGIIKHDGKYFVQKRPPKGLMAGLWEFPGGKIEKGESAREALERELQEELHVRVTSADSLIHLKHSYTRFQVRLHAWTCRTRPLPRTDKNHRWMTPTGLMKLPMPSVNAKIIKRLTGFA